MQYSVFYHGDINNPSLPTKKHTQNLTLAAPFVGVLLHTLASYNNVQQVVLFWSEQGSRTPGYPKQKEGCQAVAANRKIIVWAPQKKKQKLHQLHTDF